MAATQILATASTGLSSADTALTAGTVVCLKGVTNGGFVTVELKDDGGGYNKVGELTAVEPAKVITAPGTYRFTRRAGATCGVFSG